jgi:hypothetical protein
MHVGIIFLCAAPLFWTSYPRDGGPIAAVVFATIGALFIALDLLM